MLLGTVHDEGTEFLPVKYPLSEQGYESFCIAQYGTTYETQAQVAPCCVHEAADGQRPAPVTSMYPPTGPHRLKRPSTLVPCFAPLTHLSFTDAGAVDVPDV